MGGGTTEAQGAWAATNCRWLRSPEASKQNPVEKVQSAEAMNLKTANFRVNPRDESHPIGEALI